MSTEPPLLSVPELLADPARLLTYTPVTDAHSTALDTLLQEYQQLNFDATLHKAVTLFEKGDPRQLERKASWFQRFLGKDIEREADYYLSCLQIDKLLEQGDAQFERLNTFISELEPLWRSVSQEGEVLNVYLDRYREVLTALEQDPARLASLPSMAAFPGAGDGPGSALEALRRQQANLELQATVYGQTALQAQMVLHSMAPLQEQWQKLRHSVIPLWRQNRILRSSSKHLQKAVSSPLSRLTTLMSRSDPLEETTHGSQEN